MTSRSRSSTNVNDLCYVYCAVEGAVDVLPPATMPQGDPARALALHDNVSLIVSSVPAAVYTADVLEPKLADLDWVSEAGAAHHAVVDALADRGKVVLPFRLFTLFSTEAKALSTLAQSRVAMARAFDRIRDRQEWVLRIGKPDPSRSEPTPPTPRATGTNFLQAKAEARREAAARATRAQQDSAAAFEALQQLALASKSRPVDGAGALLLDAAFLVEPSRIETMRDTLTRRAERLLQDGCSVSLTGPWPPYSFAAMDAGDD